MLALGLLKCLAREGEVGTVSMPRGNLCHVYYITVMRGYVMRWTEGSGLE